MLPQVMVLNLWVLVDEMIDVDHQLASDQAFQDPPRDHPYEALGCQTGPLLMQQRYLKRWTAVMPHQQQGCHQDLLMEDCCYLEWSCQHGRLCQVAY